MSARNWEVAVSLNFTVFFSFLTCSNIDENFFVLINTVNVHQLETLLETCSTGAEKLGEAL